MTPRTLILVVLGVLTVLGRDTIVQLPFVHTAVVWAGGGVKTVSDRLDQYGEAARSRLAPFFAQADVAYPPKRLTIAYFKLEKRLDLYAPDRAGKVKHLRSYDSTAASGVLGPKLREGDFQVPEGLYKIVFLNPNSKFHLSLRVNYPNDYDKNKAKAEGRSNLGGDIMIHGSFVSIGCIALGDVPAEDLFVLAADVGIKNIDVVLSPVDFRKNNLPSDFKPSTSWTTELYGLIRQELVRLPVPSV